MSDMDPLKTRGLWKYVVKKTKHLNDMKKAAEKEEKRLFHQRKRAEIQRHKKVAFEPTTQEEGSQNQQARKKVFNKMQFSDNVLLRPEL